MTESSLCVSCNSGTVFWSVGKDASSQYRRLIVDNLGRSGANTMLTDPGRSLYAFDELSLVNMGRLAWIPARLVPFPIAATLTVANMIGG